MEEQTSDLELSTTGSENEKRDHRGHSILSLVFPPKNILRTLSDLCVRTLAANFGPDPLPLVAEDPNTLHAHYDALDVDLPLAKCCHITNERFWIRVVLAKHPDKSLAIRRNVNWKNLGISLKYIEMVEAASVEYWPEEEMTELAMKIKDFVTEMHIRRLQSLKERSFEKYYRPQTSSEDEDEESISEGTDSSVPTSVEEPIEFPLITDDQKTESQIALERQLAREKARRKHARQILREDKANARLEREARRQRREAKRMKRENAMLVVKKKRRRNVKSFFEIEISEDDENEEQFILDMRNKELFLKHKKGYNYPPEHCHHIDLGFVHHFKNLDTFIIEFLGPLQTRNYHHRHVNFSHDDIKRLAQGISVLPLLRVFRLRNSRMDAEKLLIMVRGLRDLKRLETVDFGFDNLGDDSASAFFELFENTSTIKSLELESNHMGEEVLQTLGETLQHYKKGRLEHLGLSRNPVSDEALHSLVSAILGTPHISSLSLRGVNGLTQNGLICCIANELLREHQTLLKLDLTAVRLEEGTVDKMIKALDLNQKILEFHCMGCGLDEEAEMDIAVLLKRNKYIADNPYVGDQTKTDEEIDEWLNQTKNPILLQVFAERDNLSECPTKRFKELMPTPEQSLQVSSRETLKSEHSISDSNIIEDTEVKVVKVAKEKPKLFVERPYVDPEENNMYLKNFKAKFVVWNQLKNISLV